MLASASLFRLVLQVVVLLSLAAPVLAQATSASIQGTVRDEQQNIVPGATVTVRNVDTNLTRSAVTGPDGQYRFLNLPVGNYELKVELQGFGTYVQSGITLLLNQAAVAEVTIKAAALAETVEVRADTPLLNTTNSEVGVRFDTRRIAELPVSNSRDVFSLALSAAGVGQVNQGQSAFASGTNFSVNGMRTRSNNFMLDGQDSNDPSVAGRTQPINNTDIVQEIRLVTNQFAAEYGRAAGSVMNVITKSGSNSFHGSAAWFHNDNSLNARQNTDKAAGRAKAPPFQENQYGGTIGGPVLKDRTFFFGSYQRWTQDALGSGFTLNGAPTDAGRQVLQAAAGSRPQVQALLEHLPAAQAGIGRNATFVLNGVTYTVPLGSLTGSSSSTFRNHQASGRVDQQWGGSDNIGGRYLFNKSESAGTGQVTPPGLTTVSPSRQDAFTAWWTKIFSSTIVNEFRFGYQRLDTTTTAADTSSEEIPSLEINELGLIGFNAAASRTAIGLAVNLPQYRINDTYQYTDNLSWVKGRHALKTGFDVRRINVESFFFPTIRGLLRYETLQRFIDDNAQAASINKPLPGGEAIQFYRWTDFFAYVQDEWRATDTLTLNFGVRYETPGNSIASLYPVNDQVVETAGGDQRYLMTPKPARDTNNWQPRVGFNWNPHTSGTGILGFLTGGDRMVVRGGYARTNDYAFININLNIASSFPFVAAISSSLQNAFAMLPNAAFNPATNNPDLLTRTIVSDDFGSPSADQFSLEVQREIGRDLVARVGYVGTQGNDLFQTLDGNPRQPFSSTRVDPTRGVIRERSNTAESSYHSLQTSLEKRFRGGIGAGVHYTWSKFLDTASEIFNVSSGEIAVSQDSFNIGADKGRSSFDRPHRFTGNFVWELPFYRSQETLTSKILGGWQVSSNFTFQSGSPFTVLNGADPTGALSGIDQLVGNAIRPNINTDKDLSKMTITEILAAGGRSLFKQICGAPSATCPGERVGNVGRNTLRTDGIGTVDVGFIKNTRFGGQNFQIRVEAFNVTNTRNFGVPDGRVNSANFLNQWSTPGGARTIWLAGRYTF